MSAVICAGMIRAGSTLQFQLTSRSLEFSGLGRREQYRPEPELVAMIDTLRGEVGHQVVKAHVCTPELASRARDGIPVIYCFRDIRDVAVSAVRKFNLSFSSLVNKRWLDQAIRDWALWTAMPNVSISRYEDMVCDPSREVQKISSFLGLGLSTKDAQVISSEYSIERQRQRIQKLRTKHGSEIASGDLVFDEVELLHHNHIHEGRVGGWRQSLSQIDIDFLNDRYAEWLRKVGYEF